MADEHQFTLHGNVLVNQKGIPRRNIFQYMSREERQLEALYAEVEKIGPHPEVMAVLYLLKRAKDRLGDYIDRHSMVIND